MNRAALALACALLEACAIEPGTPHASPCPAPFVADAAREARVVALASADHEGRKAVRDLSPVCFGPVRSPGVLVDGQPMLDARSQDDALAARLAHLGVHVHDDLGDGCKHGRARAVASEERARALEGRLRARKNLGPAPDEVKDAAADYAARCEK